MIRIAFVTNAPPDSGMGKPAAMLLKSLRAHQAPTEVFDEYRLDASEHTVRRNDAVVARLRPWGHAKPLAWLRLGRALRFDGYDLVHFTNQTLAFLVASCRAPTVLTVWDLIEREHPQELGGALAARVLFRGIPRATHLVTVSQETTCAIERLYRVPRDRITHVPPAPSPAFTYQPELWNTVGGRAFLAANHVDQTRSLVLYVGSEHPRKNLPRLLEALARVRTHIPTVEFVKIGGAGSRLGRTAFVRTADRFGLWPTIRRIDRADDVDLLYWYHAATVLAFPTLHEGFGLPPLEAMACGTPVVTSDRSSLPEVVGGSALLVNPNDVQAIADALLRVLPDQSLRSELRARGLLQAKHFTEERTYRDTRAVYQRVLNTSRV